MDGSSVLTCRPIRRAGDGRLPYGDNGENKGLTVWLTVWTVWHLQPYGLYGAHSNPGRMARRRAVSFARDGSRQGTERERERERERETETETERKRETETETETERERVFAVYDAGLSNFQGCPRSAAGRRSDWAAIRRRCRVNAESPQLLVYGPEKRASASTMRARPMPCQCRVVAAARSRASP